MSPMHGPRPDRQGSFPRVSGDEPTLTNKPTRATMFSPRERG